MYFISDLDLEVNWTSAPFRDWMDATLIVATGIWGRRISCHNN